MWKAKETVRIRRDWNRRADAGFGGGRVEGPEWSVVPSGRLKVPWTVRIAALRGPARNIHRFQCDLQLVTFREVVSRHDGGDPHLPTSLLQVQVQPVVLLYLLVVANGRIENDGT
jgi:hypothetical protein